MSWRIIRADDATVERMARAMCEVWAYRWDADPSDPEALGDDSNLYDDRPSKRVLLEAARAALTAAQGGSR